MEKNQSEQFVAWFNDRMVKGQSLTFGDVSKNFDCSFEYVEDDVFLHFSDNSKALFQYDGESELYHPMNITNGI